MSYQPTQILYGSGEHMEVESSTYTCPHCHADILQANRDTHEARCARMNRDQPQVPAQTSNKQQTQNLGRQEQRDTNGLRITREHSSSSIPYPEEPTNQMRQPQVRREARRVAENKLVTCANCERSIREDDLATHQRYECQGSDKIPCEYCDKQIAMTEYQGHIDHCPKKQEEDQQERARSLERQRQNEENIRQVQADPRRVNSAERRPTSNVNTQPQRQERQERQEQQQQPQEGHGFMNFLKTLATAALQNRSDVEDSTQPQSQTQAQNQQRQQRQQQEQRPQQQERQQQQAQQPSFLARLLGFHAETPEEAEQRRQQRAIQQQRQQERQEQRRQAEMERRQREAEMLRNLFEPRSESMMENMMRGNQPQGRNVRTIRFGPHGSIVISSNNRGGEQAPLAGYQPRQTQFMEHEMEEMGPLGVLLSMMNGGVPGMRVVSPEELEGMSQEQQAGLAREVLDSLSVINYDPEKNKNVSEDLKSCPICIEDFTDGDEVRYLWCMHRFHKGCVDKWLEKHSNCPICKKEYSESEVSFE